MAANSNKTLLSQPPENNHSIISIEGPINIINSEEVMYPIKNLFEEVVKQEDIMWNKTQGVNIPLEDNISAGGEEIEEEHLSVGRGSFTSFHSSFNHDTKLYLIRYGQLTKTIHKYFRKLEKEHACLYLSGRRANFQNLRLHNNNNNPRQRSSSPNEEARSAVRGMLRVHSLRDEERFVYRCALMASQFPMLSAPSPPDDNSPSPPFPPLPIGTAPSESSLAMGLINQPTHTDQMPGDSVPITQTQESVSNGFKLEPQNAHKTDLPEIKLQPQSLTPPTRSKSARSNSRKHRASRNSFRSIGGEDSDDDDVDIRRGIDKQNGGRLEMDNSDDEVVRLCHSRGSKFLDPLGRDQPYPAMVNREMLCSLVRRAFNQTEEQQIQYDQILRHENGRKSKGEVLARELVGQLQILENNAHPFYKPRYFVTRNGYDMWLQAEKQRIKDQLDKFWHYQLPSPHTWSHSAPHDYHKAYILLQEKVICSESKSPRREPVHGGRTPSGPLSATSQRLLTEFGLRYGVGELFQQIVYLEYLAKHFDYEVWYIRHCTGQLRLIRSLLPRNRSKTIATRKEMEILKATVFLLHGQTDNSLTRIDRLFHESDPVLGVATLIDLLREVLDTEQTLFNQQRMRSIESSLQKYLKGGFVLRYERRKEIISDEISVARNIAPFELSPVLVNALLLSIREEVNDYRDTYQAVFRRYFNIVPFAQVEFYRLLCSDAWSLCARSVHSLSSRQKLDLEMLGLLYRLNDRDNEWGNIITLEMQQWRNQFVHLALIWMDVLAKQVKEWILRSLEDDQWTLLTFYLPSTDTTTSTTNDRTSQIFSSPLNIISPYPSSLTGFPLSVPSTLTVHTSSAFTPVQHTNRTPLSPLSELSGGISSGLSSSSQHSYGSENGIKPNQHDLLNFSSNGGPPLVNFHNPSFSSLTPPPLIPPSLINHNDSTPKESPPTNNNAIGFTIVADVYPEQPPINKTESTYNIPNESDIEVSVTSTVTSLPSSPSNSVSCLSATPCSTSGFHTPADMVTSSDNFTKGGSTTPTALSIDGDDEQDTEEEAGQPQFVPRVFIPIQGPVPVPLEPHPLVVDSPIRLPRNPPNISIIPSLSNPRRLYTNGANNSFDQNGQVTPTGHARPNSGSVSGHTGTSESPPISPSSSSTLSTHLIPHYFPVSSSPIDLITMLSRLGNFVGMLLNVLTPRMKRGLRQYDELGGSLEVPREVLQARKLVTNIQQKAENMKIEFLRKIHKVLINSIKLYVDNLLCMDFCCWPKKDAMKLLGEEGLHNLQRRKESGEVWGCRHVVEARNGLHTGGLPCSKNTKFGFEAISRDMCVRVNNIHVLLTTFPSLENHIYNKTTSTTTQSSEYNRPDLSSESSTHLKLDGKSPQLRSSHVFPHRYRPEKQSNHQLPPLTILPTDDTTTNATSSDTGTTSRSGLGMTPLSRRKIETGFQSNESHQLMEYLKNVQMCQLKMICVRMNRFFKSALSLLLDLKLGNCPIDRRLDPLKTFLTRHCNALRKYLYPECFNKLVNCLWCYILEDIELEAMKLTKLKKGVVKRASLLLETTSHLIKTFYRNEQLLSLEKLSSSTEYVLALINVFIQPTERLINSFTRLSSPHFTHNIISFDQSPVPIDPQVIRDLSKYLHGERKCFTGEQFVGKLIEIGQENEDNHNEQNPTHSNETPTNARLVNYSIPYAIKLGQYLLKEGIMVCLFNYETRNGHDNNNTMESTSASRLQAMNTSLHGEMSSRNGQSPSHEGTTPTPSSVSSTPDSYGNDQDRIPTPQPAEFKNSTHCYYRFSNIEDTGPTGSFFQRIQILSATPTTMTPENKMQIPDFDQARFGTLFLILDVCQNRSKTDRLAKNFLLKNETVRISNQRTGNKITCSKIFHV